MALIFRIERAKKMPRVTVLREKKEGTKRAMPELLGSFNEQRPYNHIVEKLNETELYEFYNFVGAMTFAKSYFQCPVDELDRFMFKAPPQMKDALYKIWLEAEKYGIEFLPDQEMLRAVLNRGKAIEQQLKELTNNQFSALSDLEIDLREPFLQPTSSMRENKKIMSALFDAGLSYDELADKFNEIAKSINKNPKFTSNHFKQVQEKLLLEGKETFAKWHYAVAITVLRDLGVNLLDVTSPAIVTQHWLRLNKQKALEKTVSSFNADFVDLSKNTVCHNIIMKTFMDDEFITMGHLSKNQSPVASIAVDKWVHHWKRSSKTSDVAKATRAFKKQFPISAQNQYIEALLASYFD